MRAGQVEWRGLDTFSAVHHLPVAIQLEKFTIDEYPPKLMLIDNMGLPLPKGKPENILLDKNVKSGQLLDCKIEVLKRLIMLCQLCLVRWLVRYLVV